MTPFGLDSEFFSPKKCREKVLPALLMGVASLFLFLKPAVIDAEPPLVQRPAMAVFRSPFSLLALHGREAAKKTQSGTAAIQSVLDRVRTPRVQAVAEALGITLPRKHGRSVGPSGAGMEVIGDLDGDGVPEVAVEWMPPVHRGARQQDRAPALNLLSWDGNRWRASHLMNVVNPFGLEVLPGSRGGARLVAVIVSVGVTRMPYPVIFQYWHHAAQKIWDSRSDSSLYTGYDYGAVRFKEGGLGGFPEMVALGRADPGLLVFPKDPHPNGRGFEERATYRWRDNAYVPVGTRYERNEDYTLYRFIAALHLHEYKSAYSLIDPARFLNTRKPSLKLFRERIQKQWSEFLDDHIFEVPAGAKGSEGHVFILPLANGAQFVYHPSVTSASPYRLTGLQRVKEKAGGK